MFIKIEKLTRQLFGSRDTKPKTKSKPRAQPSNPYHAVSVRFSRNNSCDAVKQLGDTRLLASQAPMLPLPGCTNSRCKCTFVHHKDRRSGPRRDEDAGLAGATYAGDERRKRRHGRRKTDDPYLDEADLYPAPDYFSFAKTSASRSSGQKTTQEKPSADEAEQQ